MILSKPVRALLISALFLTPADFLWGVQVEPVAELELLGGQFFFEGENTSFSGNGNWLVAPGLKFNDRFSLIPAYSGKYRRVREVQELIGGSFLTRETLENSAVVKGIYSSGGAWKWKAKGSYKNQLLVESEDEELGKGLFDNYKIGMGLEAERTGSRLKSLRLSVDPYLYRYLRYQSLASSSQFGSEINNGVNTLDFNALDLGISADFLALPATLVSGSALASYRPFTEQKKISASGVYTDEGRVDWFGQLNMSLSQMMPASEMLQMKSMAGLDLSYAMLESNQHNYDAARTTFNMDYYDYREYHVTPRWVFRFFEKADIGLCYDFSRRDYSQRPTQSSDGSYESEKIYVNTHSLSLSFKYPLVYGLSAVAQGVYRRSTSNMSYERTYRYNYNAQHYFVGLSWEY